MWYGEGMDKRDEYLFQCNTQAEVDDVGRNACPIRGRAIVNWPKRRIETWYSGCLYSWIALRALDRFPGDTLAEKWAAYVRCQNEEAARRNRYVANYHGGAHDR